MLNVDPHALIPDNHCSARLYETAGRVLSLLGIFAAKISNLEGFVYPACSAGASHGSHDRIPTLITNQFPDRGGSDLPKKRSQALLLQVCLSLQLQVPDHCARERIPKIHLHLH